MEITQRSFTQTFNSTNQNYNQLKNGILKIEFRLRKLEKQRKKDV